MDRASLLVCLAGGVLVGALVFGAPARRAAVPPAGGACPAPDEPVAGTLGPSGPAQGGGGRDAAGPGPDAAPTSQPTAELADPDRVGECPPWNGQPASSPTIRRGIDGDGYPTWWHADGSLTKRVVQTGRDASGTPFRLPATLRLKKAGAHPEGRPEAAAAVQK